MQDPTLLQNVHGRGFLPPMFAELQGSCPIPARGLSVALAAAALLSLPSCGSGSKPLAVVDPEAAPARPTYEQVKTILDHRCVPCHKGGGPGGDAARPAPETRDLVAAAGNARATPAPPGSRPLSTMAMSHLLPAPLAAEDEGGGDYSTCQGIEAGLEGILHAAVEAGSMPPGAMPRLTEREKLIVSRWIDQGACSPCKACR